MTKPPKNPRAAASRPPVGHNCPLPNPLSPSLQAMRGAEWLRRALDVAPQGAPFGRGEGGRRTEELGRGWGGGGGGRPSRQILNTTIPAEQCACHTGWSCINAAHRIIRLHDATQRDAFERKGPQRRPQKRLGRRSEEVAKAGGGGYCRLQTPFKAALAVRETVPGGRLGALEGGGGAFPPSNASLATYLQRANCCSTNCSRQGLCSRGRQLKWVMLSGLPKMERPGLGALSPRGFLICHGCSGVL